MTAGTDQHRCLTQWAHHRTERTSSCRATTRPTATNKYSHSSSSSSSKVQTVSSASSNLYDCPLPVFGVSSFPLWFFKDVCMGKERWFNQSVMEALSQPVTSQTPPPLIPQVRKKYRWHLSHGWRVSDTTPFKALCYRTPYRRNCLKMCSVIPMFNQYCTPLFTMMTMFSHLPCVWLFGASVLSPSCVSWLHPRLIFPTHLSHISLVSTALFPDSPCLFKAPFWKSPISSDLSAVTGPSRHQLLWFPHQLCQCLFEATEGGNCIVVISRLYRSPDSLFKGID